MKLKLTGTAAPKQENCNSLAKQIGIIAYKALNPDIKAEIEANPKFDYDFICQEACYNTYEGRYYFSVEATAQKIPCGRIQLFMLSAVKSSRTFAIMALLAKLSEAGTDSVVFQLDAIEGEPNFEFSLFYVNSIAALNKLEAILERLKTIDLEQLDVEL